MRRPILRSAQDDRPAPITFPAMLLTRPRLALICALFLAPTHLPAQSNLERVVNGAFTA